MTTIPDHVPDDLHSPTIAPEWGPDELLALREEWADEGHDFDAPESGYARTHLALVGHEMRPTVCQHCRPDYRLRPLRGTAWGIEWFHANACPESS